MIDLRYLYSEATGDHRHITTPSSVPSDPAMMGLLKYWFTECCNNHALCLPSSSSFSPTRLLLLENEHSTRVVETTDWTIRHPYAALSHCWGNANRLKLQKSNMMDLSKHLSIKELPTTYREGIFVSLALGISYIWIDSLCIIQDDEEDWSKEAAMMKDVFEHCSVNLSATAAADSSQSNFRDRDPEIIPPLEVTVSDWKWEEPGQSKFWLAIKWVDMRREDIVYSPLHSRAWVFQEASLSRRRIDLARTQMWWSCQQNWACETYPLGVWDVSNREYQPGERGSLQYFNMLKQRGFDHNAMLSICPQSGPSSQAATTVADSNTWPEQKEDHQAHWFEQVRIYSDCGIIETKDRLIAFAGIAQRYAQVRGLSLGDYLAGIWRQELPHSLCLRPNHKKLSYRPDGYRAPSWSWASLEGPVKLEGFQVNFLIYGLPQLPPLCKVVDAKVIHQLEHCQAGGMKGGVIHLRGRLVERILDSQVPKWPNDKSIKGLTNAKVDNYDFDESWDVRDSKTPHLRPPRVSYLEHPQGRPDQRKEGVVDGAVRKSIRFNTLDELSEHVRLFILPIVANTRTKVAICLMLCQTLDDSFAGNNIYQRVGTYWWCLSRWSVEDLEPVPERDVYII